MIGSPRRGAAPETWALGGLLLFTALAVAGYGIFALHPERLPATGFAPTVYRHSFEAFAQLHIVVSAVVLGVALARGAGLRAWAAAFAFVYAASFLSEFVGTGWGIPFGGYAYTGLLGARLGGRVPALIPLSWFLMAVPSWIVARRILGASGGRSGRIVVGAALMVTWDLSLDPAMSWLTRYWRWEDAGPYYGMPLVNLAGWALTAAVLMWGLERLGPADAGRGPGSRWFAAYWATVVLMPLGMCLAAGLVGVLAATVGGLAVAALLAAALRAAAPVGAGAQPGRRREVRGTPTGALR